VREPVVDLLERVQRPAALDEEEGRLADMINQTAGMRAWDLWRSQVKF